MLPLVLDLDDDGEDENECEVDEDFDGEAAFGKWTEPAGRPRAYTRGSDPRGRQGSCQSREHERAACPLVNEIGKLAAGLRLRL